MAVPCVYLKTNYFHMKRFIFILSILFQGILLQAQSISGNVFERIDGKKIPIEGAVASWIGTTQAASSNSNGNFKLTATGITDKRLVVTFVGYTPDTLTITTNAIKVELKANNTLKTVEVPWEREATMISARTLKTEIIGDKELKKAACCNLGESFTTNATVDISVKDAVFGSKEIQVLGLAGAYTQLLTENTPLITGLGQTYGLNYIPGTQISTINIVKGPGSVIFGPESMSGLIDVELKDPTISDKWFVNGYFDEFARKELNVDKAWKLGDSWSTLVSTHVDHYAQASDRNRDKFIDMPFLTTLSALNKWKYSSRGLFSQNSVKVLREERAAGQGDFDFTRNDADIFAYGQKLKTNRIEVYGRTGYVIPTARYQSIGVLYSLVTHEQDGFYGLRSYTGTDRSAYIRALYNTEWAQNNSLNIGVSFRAQQIAERYDTLTISKNEQMPGAFIENTYTLKSKVTLITGIRADKLNDQTFITPRANIKYSITEFTAVRGSIGSGFRTSNVLAENPAILSSNKKIVIGKLAPEQSLNYGVNLVHEFKLDYRKGSFGVDVYRTVFSNKIIPDYETDFQAVIFKNLIGKSYADNIQIEAAWKVLKQIELKLAYKYLDVYTLLGDTKTRQPYIAKHRTLSTLFYESLNRKWSANFVWQWLGEKRLPKLDPYHTAHEKAKFSDFSMSYSQFNTQLTRKFKKWEFYVGMENIFDFRQTTHVLSADNPYSRYFDTSYVWGPLDGRKIYTGFRYALK